MSDHKKLSRKYATSQVMQAVVNCGPISRASIAKQTGLSKQTVSEIMQELEDGGWVRETGRTSGHIGRTAITYELVPDAAFVVGVDLGGTKVRLALIDLSGRVVAESREPTHPAGGAAVVDQIGRLCRSVVASSATPPERVVFAVVGVPGVPEPTSGRVLLAPNIAGLDDMDLAGRLAENLGVETEVLNDVNLAALGEHWAGSAADVDDLVYISIGTGIGAGLIIGGNLIRGASGAAGELGFVPIGADPFEPESRRVGSFERQAGSFGMIARYRELTGQAITVPALFDAMALGDEAAAQVIDETARLFARLVAAVASVVDPARVVLGGSIGLRPELLEPVRKAVAECFPFPVRLTHSELGSHAALVGAAAVGLQHLHHQLFASGVAGAEIVLPELTAPNWKGAVA